MTHRFQQLIITMLLGHITCHLQLLILLLQSLVELRQLGLDILFDIPLLIFDNLLNFVFESVL